MIEANTIIEEWYIITFDPLPEFDFSGGKILFGYVIEDKKGRWNPGDWCCTTLITGQLDERTYKTSNTVYQVIDDGKEVTMPVTALQFLRLGLSPDMIDDMKAYRASSHDNDDKANN